MSNMNKCAKCGKDTIGELCEQCKPIPKAITAFLSRIVTKTEWLETIKEGYNEEVYERSKWAHNEHARLVASGLTNIQAMKTVLATVPKNPFQVTCEKLLK